MVRYGGVLGTLHLSVEGGHFLGTSCTGGCCSTKIEGLCFELLWFIMVFTLFVHTMPLRASSQFLGCAESWQRTLHPCCKKDAPRSITGSNFNPSTTQSLELTSNRCCKTPETEGKCTPKHKASLYLACLHRVFSVLTHVLCCSP